jgi:hypothetical protein
MTILNCTLKLSKRIPFQLTESPVPATNRLGPWSGNTFNIGRFPCIILTNHLTLLSVLILSKDIHTFWSRFLISLEGLLEQIQLPLPAIQEELRAMQEVQFTRGTNRRTLGSMTDLVHMVRAIHDQDPNMSLDAISLELSNVVCFPLDGLYPRDAVHRAFHRLSPKWN